MGNCLPILSGMCPPPQQFDVAWATLASALSSLAVLIGSSSSRVLVEGPGEGRLVDDVAELYLMGSEIDRGKFGIIRRCLRKSTGEAFACKSIAKSRLRKERERESVRHEVALLRSVRGHPDVVWLEEALEDKAAVHLIMELCEGGNLFRRIENRPDCYSETEAALILKTLAGVIHHCHSKGIMHRDLKPENILFSSSAATTIKLADFGLAIPFTPGQKFRSRVGSPYYVAPEILDGEYSEEIDVWSAGIILYILLCGYPPFSGRTLYHIMNAIRRRKIQFLKQPWPCISDDAKDLIQGMLHPNAHARLTPSQILNHPWIMKHTCPIISLPPLPFAVSAPTVEKEGLSIVSLRHSRASNSRPHEDEEESIMNKLGCPNYFAKTWIEQEDSRSSAKWDALLLLSSVDRDAFESVISSLVYPNSFAMPTYLDVASSVSSTPATVHHRRPCGLVQMVYLIVHIT